MVDPYPRHLLLLLALSLSVAGSAQVHAQRYRFEHLTVAEGLPQNSAWALLQDHLGMIWIGTQAGLVKYDGYTLKAYKPDPDVQTWANSIYVLHEDPAGHLWLGTWAGLYRFDRATERFTAFRHEQNNPSSLSAEIVTFIHEDRLGYLWLVTRPGDVDWGIAESYLDRFDPRTGIVKRFRHAPDQPESLGSGMVPRNQIGDADMIRYPFLEDREGRIWVGTDGGGLSRHDPEIEGFIHYRNDPGDAASLSHDHVSAIAQSRDGTLWVGTYGGGLNQMNPDTGTFVRYRHDSGNTTSLVDDRIFHLYADHLGQLWVSTRGGLCRVDPARVVFSCYPASAEAGAGPGHASSSVVLEELNGDLWFVSGTSRESLRLAHYRRAQDGFTLYSEDTTEPGSLIIADRITSSLLDRSGVLWFGSQMGGLNKLARSTQKFRVLTHDSSTPNSLSYDAVRAVYKDREGAVWIGTEGGGLDHFDPVLGRFIHYRHDPEDPGSLSNDRVWSIHEDRRGRLWVGTDGGGLNRLDRSTGRFTRFRQVPGDPGSFQGDVVSTMFEDREGRLWFGTFDGGLNLLNPSTDTFTHFRHDPEDPTSISQDDIHSIQEGRDSVLWVGTNGGGLNRFDRRTGSFRRFPDPSNSLCAYEDRAGRFWICNFNGLVLFDRTTGTPRWFRQEHGMPRNRTLGLVEDADRRLWVLTEAGLALFDPDTETVLRTYDASDGLPTSRFWQRYFSHRSDGGDIYLGTQGGVIAYDPARLAQADNPHPPQVALTNFRLGDEAVSVGVDSPLDAHISVAETIELRHVQNDFTITYAALHFAQPQKNRYRYRLEGYDETWREAGTKREATYMNLPSGDYTFRVIASNNDGVWNEEGASLRITILPPWWQTGWAYSLYGLLVIAAAAQAYRWQHNRIVRREREAARERELEQARQIEKAHHELQVSHQHLKATQAQLIQSEKMASLGQLTAGIAHEIKNPLNFVNNFAEVNEELADELREALANGESVDDLLDDLKQNAGVIKQHGKRADGIVHAMMQHASGGTGQREATNVNALVSEHIDLAYHGKRAQVPDLMVEIKRELGEDVGDAEVIPQEIGRVLLNLLGNAFDAVYAHASRVDGAYTPTVTVTTRQVDAQVEIRVSDNGSGIPEEIKDRIFEPFFTTKPTGGGSTGLGLSLSYDIVTQGHGGTLTVESEEGEGATFIVTLPMKKTEAASNT